MMKMAVNQKQAQSTLEYAVLIVCIVAGLLAMQIYIKRSIQGKLRGTADSMGEQYDPKKTSSDITVTFKSEYETTMETKEDTQGKITSKSKTDTVTPDKQTTKGWETVEGF